MSLYLIVIVLTVIVPLLLSFEKNLRFYRQWKFLLPAIFLVMIFFVAWDALFVNRGYWGFNPGYVGGAHLFGLPLEEILFFVAIPYASIFAYSAIRFHFPKYRLSNRATFLVFLFLVFFSVTIVSINYLRPYTLLVFIVFPVVLFLGYKFHPETLSRFLAVFPVLLVPFFVVNGILTGSWIENEVVWYNPAVFAGRRILTFPAEDIFYGFTLIFSVLILSERLEMAATKKATK